MQIDWWTLALQTVNVVILVWLLARFFFKPILAIVAQRQAAADKALADVKAADETVAKAHQEADDVRARISEERESLVAEAKQAAKAEYDARLAEADGAVAGMKAKAREELARERTAAEDALVARASDLSVSIARRLLKRLPSDVALDTFAEELCRQIRDLPEQDRAAFASTNNLGESLEVVTPEPLDEGRRHRLQQSIDGAFGSPTRLTFDTNPSLIAGIELRSRGAVVANSWKSDLEKINVELKRNGGQSGPASGLA